MNDKTTTMPLKTGKNKNDQPAVSPEVQKFLREETARQEKLTQQQTLKERQTLEYLRSGNLEQGC